MTPVENSKTGRKELIVTKQLILTHAEFHPWIWKQLLPLSQLDSLTFELLMKTKKRTYCILVIYYATLNLNA